MQINFLERLNNKIYLSKNFFNIESFLFIFYFLKFFLSIAYFYFAIFELLFSNIPNNLFGVNGNGFKDNLSIVSKRKSHKAK